MRNTMRSKIHVSAQVQMSQHHAFRVAGRTGGVVEDCQVIEVIGRIVYIVYRHALRECFLVSSFCSLKGFACLLISVHDRHVVHEDCRFQTLHLFGVNLLLYVRTYIQQHCFRVIYE